MQCMEYLSMMDVSAVYDVTNVIFKQLEEMIKKCSAIAGTKEEKNGNPRY